MKKRVLDIGNCDPDHGAICRLIEGQFDASVDRAHGLADAQKLLAKQHYDLVLVNRKLDRDYSDGLDVIKNLKANQDLMGLPVMMLTNFAEHQDAAVAAGAERGFGKLEYDQTETYDKLARFLGD